jgi:hypothetical protein
LNSERESITKGEKEESTKGKGDGALLEVVAFHHPGSPAAVEQVAASLLQALS